jgi:uncharacterized protein
VDVTVSDVPERSRYEAHDPGGALAGFLDYRWADGLLVARHTEVDPAYEGQGVGGALSRHVLDRARADGVRVDPRCPFLRGWLERHPEYADVVRPPTGMLGPDDADGGSPS